MKFLSCMRLLRNRQTPNPIPNQIPEQENADNEEEDYVTASSGQWRIDDGNEINVTSGGRNAETEDTASSSGEGRSIKVNEGDDESSKAFVREEGKKNTDSPPTDDCCPICFGVFVVPCKATCGHWYCGGCILQYWNYGVALQPCKCPMCSQKVTNLTPEASLDQQQEVEVIEVLKNIKRYNRLFVGGAYGFALKLFELPLYVKRIFQDMMNPDRPGAHLNKLRIFAMLLGVLYTFSPFDFLRIGRQNVVDVFDYSAMGISFFLYMFGLYLRRRRFQRVREMAAIQL